MRKTQSQVENGTAADWSFLLVGGIVVLAAGALRFWHLGWSCLWLDEIITATIARRGPAEILRFTRHDTGPLFFSYFFEWWVAGFDSVEFWVRFPSAFFGTAAVILMAPAARAMGLSRRGAMLAVGLLAFSSHHIYYSREARGYALLTFTALASFYLLNRWITSCETNRTRSALHLFAFCTICALGLFTSYFFAPVAAVVFVYAYATLLRQRRIGEQPVQTKRKLLQLTATAGLLAVIYLAWCWIAFPTMSAYNNAGVQQADIIEWLSQTSKQWLSLSPKSAPVTVLALVAAAWAAYIQLRVSGWLLTVGVLLLSVLVLTVAQHAHFLAPRYLLAVLPFFLIQIAGLLDAAIQLIQKHLRFDNAYGCAAAALLIAAWTYPNIRDYHGWYSVQKQDWNSVTQYLKDHVGPNDLIVPGIDLTYLCLDFYLPEKLKPQLAPNHSGTAENLPPLARTGKRIWYVAPEYSLSEAEPVHQWLDKYFTLTAKWPGINPAMTIYLYCSDK